MNERDRELLRRAYFLLDDTLLDRQLQCDIAAAFYADGEPIFAGKYTDPAHVIDCTGLNLTDAEKLEIANRVVK